MKDLLQRINQYAVDGLRDFSEHPIKYSSKALIDLVKDYWDTGLAVASGLAWTPYNKEIYSPELQPYIAGLGPIVSVATGGWMHLREDEKAADRAARNFLAFLATMGLGNSTLSSGKFDLVSTLNGIMGIGSASSAAFMEWMRRISQTNTNPAIVGPLEYKI